MCLKSRRRQKNQWHAKEEKNEPLSINYISGRRGADIFFNTQW
jgi:hypothetical protein